MQRQNVITLCSAVIFVEFRVNASCGLGGSLKLAGGLQTSERKKNLCKVRVAASLKNKHGRRGEKKRKAAQPKLKGDSRIGS